MDSYVGRGDIEFDYSSFWDTVFQAESQRSGGAPDHVGQAQLQLRFQCTKSPPARYNACEAAPSVKCNVALFPRGGRSARRTAREAGEETRCLRRRDRSIGCTGIVI